MYNVKSQAWEYVPSPPHMNHIQSSAIAYIAWLNCLCCMSVYVYSCICYVPVYMLCSSVLDYINYKISYTISITNNI